MGKVGLQSAASINGAAVVGPRERKKLTRSEKRTDEGRFAAQLETLLSERGWDYAKLAESSGIKPATIRKWLRAESYPTSWDTLRQIAKALDTSGHPFTDYRLLLPSDR